VEERRALKRAYHLLFRSGRRLSQTIEAARGEFAGVTVVLELVDFVAVSKRGICADAGRRNNEEED
jgi:acyl-[acyl carrier protein]--UDP-N-acetylglucosamine O-acyltransferase